MVALDLSFAARDGDRAARARAVTLLLSLLVLPLYVPTLIFGAEAARRGAMGLDATTPLTLLAGITFGTIALMPFASAAVLRMTLR